MERSYTLAEEIFTEISDFVASLDSSRRRSPPRRRVPEHRVVVDQCRLLSCEKRLEARLQGRPSVGSPPIQAAAPADPLEAAAREGSYGQLAQRLFCSLCC